MKSNRNEGNGGPENDPARRFHIEDVPSTQGAPPPVRGDSATSGQVGPKSQRRYSAANGPPISDTPDAPASVRDDSGMSGIEAPAKPKQQFPTYEKPPLSDTPDAPQSERDGTTTSGQVGPKLKRQFSTANSPRKTKPDKSSR